MCFSATASFMAGALLLGLGSVTIRAATSARERPFAAIPLLFGVQQLIEGGIWLSLQNNMAGPAAWLAFAYSLFSHILWPAYIPVAVLLLETAGWRRGALGLLVGIGIALGAWLLAAIVGDGITSHAVGPHIEYETGHVFSRSTAAIYGLATVVSLLLSSHLTVRLFGVLALVSGMAASWLYATWFVSVWCYFAALLSVVVLLHFKVRWKTRLPTSAAAR
jgi:hypothetical protein